MPTGTRHKVDPLRSWARSQARAHDQIEAAPFALAVAARVGRALGGFETIRYGPAAEIALTEPPGGWANPWLVGVAHEQAASSVDRTTRGAWYTPRGVVEGLVALALSGENLTPAFTVDPTCGGGAFILAVLDHLVSCGVAPAKALRSVGGVDLDPGAALVARVAIELWALANECDAADPLVEVGDALVAYPPQWPVPSAIVGNPPFASPLKANAVDVNANKFREGRPELFGPYADTAACHLVRAVDLVSNGGVVCLVQPVSVLSGRDTEAMRKHLSVVAPIEAMWCTGQAVFDAGVRVAAPVLRPGCDPAGVSLATGLRPKIESTVAAEKLQKSERQWSALAATSLGVPWVELDTSARLGDIADATAGFRDEHYGLAAACVERDESQSDLRLTTVGSIDPLFGWWGTRPTRFATKVWDKPVIEPEKLDSKVRRWLDNQMRPKVVLPTQSKVLEPLIDIDGKIVPATPVLAIHTTVERLHHVAAVLLAPPVVAWALRHSFGSALSLDAVKLSASQVQELPLPSNREPWDEAAAMLSGVNPVSYADALSLAKSVAAVMMEAYEADPEVMEWYESRFPVG